MHCAAEILSGWRLCGLLGALHVASLDDGAPPCSARPLQSLRLPLPNTLLGHTVTNHHRPSLHHGGPFFFFFSSSSPTLAFSIPIPIPTPSYLPTPLRAPPPLACIPHLIAARSLNVTPLIVIALPDHVAARPRSTSSQPLRSIRPTRRLLLVAPHPSA